MQRHSRSKGFIISIFKRNEQEEIPAINAVPALVDTSVIIDGRIADIAQAGFAPGKLLIPRFVLAELQLISDSGDSMKRSRGRRGLEILHGMRQAGIDLDIIEDDYSDIREVDAKLVRLGRKLNCNVLTTDYNLNKVASIEGVRVLNINELANAVRPVILPGERMHTKIVQPGKEKTQGVGYLADGTMIVVDSGAKFIGSDVEVEITRVFQTVAGKMLFAVLVGTPQPSGPQPKQSDGRPQGQPKRQGGGNRQRTERSDRSDQSRTERPKSNTADSGGRPSQKQGSGGGANPRRPKRVSPTQRLENSLLELTKGDDSTSTK